MQILEVSIHFNVLLSVKIPNKTNAILYKISCKVTSYGRYYSGNV